VRDIYDLGDSLLIVACDRISAYDHVLKPGIPGKGRILNQMSNFWFDRFSDVVENHLIATNVDDFPEELQLWRSQLEGRSVLVRKAEVIPFECVARGFLAGSGYKEYLLDGTVCGIPLEPGLVRASRLSEPIYTPATKAESGHDENINFEALVAGTGEEMASHLRSLTLELYRRGAEHAEAQGLILADTKFEFGMIEGRVMLIDEVLTPDSSRYWEASQWQPGEEPVSVDKQYVRNWLDASGWDHEAPAPELPDEVIQGTLERYREAFVRVTGDEPWL
jgi:phosphoribosylaminoimidazole-succinocarboxamide synthase